MSYVALAVTVAATVAGAATSYAQARQQNKAVRRSQESANRAASAEAYQVKQRESAERYRNINDARRVIGSLRVAAAEAGTGSGSSYDAVARSTAYAAEINDHIIGRNAGANLARIGSELEAVQTRLAAEFRSTGLATVQGGLQGLQLGMAVSSAGKGVAELFSSNTSADAAARANFFDNIKGGAW